MIVLGADADLEIRAQRTCDLLAQKLPDRLPRHAPKDLSQQVALGMDVVRRLGSGLPQWRLLGERLADRLRIVDRAGIQRIGDDRQRGAMIQDVAYRDLRLAVAGKLRPILRYRLIDVHQPPIHQQIESEAGDALGD